MCVCAWRGQVIAREGVDSLSVPELQAACSQRGIPMLDVGTARLRADLRQWIGAHPPTTTHTHLSPKCRVHSYA
jgi:hypothetical protein